MGARIHFGSVASEVLSFEMGLLWPGFMARFGDVFGLGSPLTAHALPVRDPKTIPRGADVVPGGRCEAPQAS